MPRMLKRFRGPLLFLMFFSVAARVLTGASEAQINFTSLIVDQNIATHSAVDEAALTGKVFIQSTSNASSIPDKHRTYATYKKYIGPDKSLSVDVVRTNPKVFRVSAIRFIHLSRIQSVIYLPVANSPPAVVSAHSHTHTTTTDTSVVTENNFGKIEIDNSAGGLGSFQL